MMPRKMCYMDLRTDPPYRQPLKVYQFLMRAANPLNDNGVYVKFPVNSYAVGKLLPADVKTLLEFACFPVSL